MMPVGGCCPLIFRLKDQGAGRNFRVDSMVERVQKQSAAKLHRLGRHDGVSRQFGLDLHRLASIAGPHGVLGRRRS